MTDRPLSQEAPGFGYHIVGGPSCWFIHYHHGVERHPSAIVEVDRLVGQIAGNSLGKSNER
jgi:hypothetical protein